MTRTRISNYLGAVGWSLLFVGLIVWFGSDDDDLAFWLMVASAVLNLLSAVLWTPIKEKASKEMDIQNSIKLYRIRSVISQLGDSEFWALDQLDAAINRIDEILDPERMSWETLPERDKQLDAEIERALAAPAGSAGPPPGTRLVLVTEDADTLFFGRDDRGNRLTFEWGEPDAHGWYAPTITAHYDDVLPAAPAAGPAIDAGPIR